MYSTTKKIVVLAFTIAALMLVGPATAQAANFDILGWNSSYTIKAEAPGAGGTGAPRSVNSGGGEFYVNIGGLGSGVAYCIDPWQSIGTGQHTADWFGPPQQAGPGNSTILTSVGGLEAAYLISQFSQVLTGVDDPMGIGMKSERTALQAAIWEVAFDIDGGYDLTTGAFHLTDGHGLSADIVARANFMLSTLPTIGGGAFSAQMTAYLNTNFRVGGFDGKQDLIGGVVGGTPEPGTMLLFGTALLGSGYFGRRRRKKA